MTNDEGAKQLPYAVLEDIYVDPEVENRGLGSMLLGKAIGACREREHKGIWGRLSSGDSDHFDKLKHFYERHGFTVTFHSPDHVRYNPSYPGEVRLDF